MSRVKRTIGFNSRGVYKTGENSKSFPVYTCWKDMISRCYYPHTSRYNSHGAKGVTVCDEWLDFQNFAKWYHSNYIKGYHLDKDILNPSAKLYGPKTCKFIPPHINCLILNKSNQYNGLPRGVCYRKDRNRYVANLCINGKLKRVGSFLTVDEAFECYKINKLNHIEAVAELSYDLNEIDKETYEALLSYNIKRFSEDE